MFQFHTPWKLLVSGIFRGYKMGALTWNGMFLILFSNWAVYSEQKLESVNKNLKRLQNTFWQNLWLLPYDTKKYLKLFKLLLLTNAFSNACEAFDST